MPNPSTASWISTTAANVPVPGRLTTSTYSYLSSNSSPAIYLRFTAISEVHEIFLCSRQDSDTLKSIIVSVWRSNETQLGVNHTLSIPNRFAYHETANPDNYGSTTVIGLTAGQTYYIKVAPNPPSGGDVRFYISID